VVIPRAPRSGPALLDGVLAVSATTGEAAYLPSDVPLLVTGVGKTAAATAVAAELARHPDPASVAVLNVGTAGALRDGLEGLHVPGAVLNHDISAAAIRSLGLEPYDRLPLPGDSDVVLATGDVFVSDPHVRAGLAARAHLVDMEGYAVAYAAMTAGAQVRLVKHVSDNADETALDWAAQVDASARVLGEWVGDHRASWC
jgi:adenosylhomocysteine nucleosidase